MARLPSSKVKMGATKAKKILSDGTVRGNPLTQAQKGLFGAIAGGAPTMGAGKMGPKMAGPKMAGSSAGAKPRARPPKQAPMGMRASLGPRTRNAIKRGM